MEIPKIGGGLSNLGNTCFFNAIMQVVLHTPALAEHLSLKTHSQRCQKKNWCIFCALENLYSQTSKSRVVAPREIVSNLRSLFHKFRLGRQQDSHQFLRYLIEGLQDSETGKLSNNNREAKQARIRKTLTFSIFGARMRTYVLCHGCHHKSLTEERYYDMNIECQSSSSLGEGLNNFFKVDQLKGINKYRCENCKQLNNAHKGFSLLTLPKVLTFQFKRFTNSLRKIGKVVNFPKILNMHKYMADQSEIDEQFCKYELYGVTVHAGSSSYSGHYFSFIKSNDIWYEMNDSNVSKCSEDRVMAQQAYILFYRRTKLPPRKIKQNHMSEEIQKDIENKKIQQQNPEIKPKNKGNHLLTDKNEIQRLSKSVEIVKINKNEPKFGKTEQSLEESQRKISMSIQNLKKQCSLNKKQQTRDMSPLSLNSEKKKKKKKKNVQGDEQIIQPPMSLQRSRSKEQAFNQMSLQEIILKYSTQLLELQSKLPRNGIGHRALRSMNILRKTEIVMKKRKLG